MITVEMLLAARDRLIEDDGHRAYMRTVEWNAFVKNSKELKVSEEVKQEVQTEATNDNVISFEPKRESISKTMIKKIRALSKDQLVAKLIDVHNYAEAQKATNMILLYQVKQLNEKLNGKPQDAAAETKTSEEKNEGT